MDFEPTFMPLEIGHTNPETTVWHLAETGGIARWPYGHDKITLLLSTICQTDVVVQHVGSPRDSR